MKSSRQFFLLGAISLFVGCTFVSSSEAPNVEEGEQFKSIVADFGEFDEVVYNDDTFILYDHNDEGLPEWMYTYTYDSESDTEHFEYVVFDKRGIPEYYNINNESVYVENVRGNLYDMIVIAEDGTFSVAPNVDAGVNLETYWSSLGGVTRSGGTSGGAASAQEIANYAKGGVNFMQGSFGFWGGAFSMLVGCAMLVPGANVVMGATLMIAGAAGFVGGAMQLAMATDLMHSDGTHTQHFETPAAALNFAGNTIGSIGKGLGQIVAEGVINGTVDGVVNGLDRRSQEAAVHEKAIEATLMALRTAQAEVNIAEESVTLYGTITGNLNAGDYVGLYVSDEPTAMHVISVGRTTVGTGGSFEAKCSGLEMGRTYYYKAYYYSASQDRTFVANTCEFVLPGVATGDYEKLSEGTYKVKVDVLLGEGLANPEVGICYTSNGKTPNIHDSRSSVVATTSGTYVAEIEPSKLPCYYRAYVVVDGQTLYGDTKMIAADERDILIQFYHDTGGDNWTRNDNWCSDKPIEEWYGVSVEHIDYDANSNTWSYGVDIDLINNNLQGSGSLAGMKSLRHLCCYSNQLTSLDVSGCTALYRLVCPGNQLTSLNVSGCTALVRLDSFSNQLTSLNVSGCTALGVLDCKYNQLTSLDVSGCTALEKLDCFDNHLTSLDVSGCTALRWLECYSNQLTSLDVSGCTALGALDCSYNHLTSLNVSGCTALVDLSCDRNQLTSLNVSGCTALWWLNCFSNQLTSLDVSGCTELVSLDCANNQLTQVITGVFAELTYFSHDERYEYWDVDKYVDGVGYVRYEDKGVGWWYPGEPQKGYHGK